MVLSGQCEPILNSVRTLDIVTTRGVGRVLIDLRKLREVCILKGTNTQHSNQMSQIFKTIKTIEIQPDSQTEVWSKV